MKEFTKATRRAPLLSLSKSIAKNLAALALGTAAMASATNAATFDFYWSALPANDPAIISSPDASAAAVGTLDINVPNGSSFDASDISNVSISFSNANLSNLVFDRAQIVAGSTSADGTTASFTDFLIDTAIVVSLFGCSSADCSQGSIFYEVQEASGNFIGDLFQYASPQTALSSLSAVATVSVVPLPSGGILLLSGLAGVAALKRRRKKQST